MRFVTRSACPQVLATKQHQWTRPWLAYYGVGVEKSPPTKPTDSHWLKDEIRPVLIDDFHNNCGYCGEAIPTPQNKQTSKGDVDHFLPKSVYPEQVYEWTNYIWSCKPCNQQKLEFNDVKYPLLNPCSQPDCDNLTFSENTGRFVLHDSVSNQTYWQERLKNTELKTMFNADELCRKRRLKVSGLRQRFESITNYLDICSKYPPVVNSLQSQINNSLTEISEMMKCPDFRLLLQDSYQSFCQKYSAVAALLP